MDTKKLLGTIIGVIMFALLIVGATYAWLTISANVTNGNYTVKTKNFVINYAGGSAINETVQTSNATIANITSETSAAATTDGWLAVTAQKDATSAGASDFTIKLHINAVDSPLTTKALTYAVCHGNCPTEVALATVSNGTATCATGVVACGTVNPSLKNTDIVLYTDTNTFNKDAAVETQTYNIYFWLDAGTIVANDIGKSFSGYIHASATQGDKYN